MSNQWTRDDFYHNTNHQIRSPTVRLIDENGINKGIVATREAIRIARELNLDLVEITNTSTPPIAKIVDYGKFIYELKIDKKRQEKRNRENIIVVKEIQLRPVIGIHDLEVKLNHAKQFLEQNHKVKIVMKFRGREIGFSQKGFDVVNQFIQGLQPCKVDKAPMMSSNSITAMISPSKEKEVSVS